MLAIPLSSLRAQQTSEPPGDDAPQALRTADRWRLGGSRLSRLARREPAAKVFTLPKISPGTVVRDSADGRWNQVVLLARPTLASGDMEMIPNTIKNMVGTFTLTIMANIEAYQEATSERQKYRLEEVGVGLSVDIDGQLTVLTSDTQKRLGADLGFIQQQMLQSSEDQLDKPRVVAKTSTLLIFDTPAIMYRDDDHRDFLMRHFVWLDSNSGRCSMLVWLLQSASDGSLRVVPEPLRWVPGGTREARRIHVDSSKFVLGLIPPESAFALEDLPPGREVAWTEEAARLAALQNYDLESIRALAAALNQSLQSLRSNN